MDPNIIFTFGIPGLVIGNMVYRKLVKPYIVSSYQDSGTEITSSDDGDAPLSALSVSQTDSRQTDRQTQVQGPSRDKLLTFYAMLREAGISREHARPVLKGVWLPLDNNLWAEAAPPEPQSEPDPPRVLRVRDNGTEERVIPFYETEPGLRYEAPPR